MIKNFSKLLNRDIKLSISNLSIIISYATFFLMSLLIFTFGIGPDIGKLNELYSPIVWVIMLFSIIIMSPWHLDREELMIDRNAQISSCTL